MASHATTINAVPASEGRQQGMYSSTGRGSKYRLTKYFSVLSTESVDNFVDNEGTRLANGRITLSIATKSAGQGIFYFLIIKHLQSIPGHGFSTASYFRSKKNCA